MFSIASYIQNIFDKLFIPSRKKIKKELFSLLDISNEEKLERLWSYYNAHGKAICWWQSTNPEALLNNKIDAFLRFVIEFNGLYPDIYIIPEYGAAYLIHRAHKESLQEENNHKDSINTTKKYIDELEQPK